MSEALRRSNGLTIGTVLTMLKADFPGITISKIRFLETEGLVEPQRANSGYRLFSPEDVERLRLILTAQRDAYLPLKVIAEKLDEGTLAEVLRMEEDTPAATPRLRAVADPTEAQDVDVALPGDQLPAGPVTKSHLLRLTGLDAVTLDRIQNAELIAADELGRYRPESVQICRAAAILMRHGIDERHWGPFRAAASRETGSIERAVAHKTDPEQRGEAVGELVNSYTALHHWLLKAGLPRS
jgi:DNA-binding transcriptional MerR regulator